MTSTMPAVANTHTNSIPNEQNRTLALLQARSRDDIAKELLEIALQRSQASAGTVLFKEDGQLVPFAVSAWEETAIKTTRELPLEFPRELGVLDHAAMIPDPILMNDVVSAFDATAIDLSVLWIPLRYRGEIVGLVYLEKNRDDRECCRQAIESFRLLAAQAATTLSNLRLTEDLEREMRLRRGVEASRDEMREALLQPRVCAETKGELSTVSRLASLGELAVSIVHEVNQPLTALLSSAEACFRWLSRNPPEVSEAQDAVSQVIREGKRAIAIVSALEALARGSRANLGHIRFADVLCEVLSLLRAELERFSVVVHSDIDETLPEIRGDSFQLQQVVFNLLRNSIEAMKQVNDRPRAIEISCRVRDSEVVAAFSDCGVASTAENTDRWFDPLFTTKDSGLGMGLSICRRIIKAHRGRIWVEKNRTFGLTFAFALPL